MIATVRPNRALLLIRRLVVAALATVVVFALGIAPASAKKTGTGPRLSVSAADLNQALTCTGDLSSGAAAPVLFLHGTTSDSQANWSWNWVRAMDLVQRPHCELDSPNNATSDIQVSAEYVVNAIRVMHQRAGKRISMVGHSQGGMVGRWALKYWPDTRLMVDDYVGLSSSNHGTDSAKLPCSAPGGCSAASWQQKAGSKFITALNDGPETWPGISYTVAATRFDELVTPSTASFLKPATNVTNTMVQDICPLETVDHFGMAYDNAAWLVGIDALTHNGPARLSRVNRSTCGDPLMPAVDRATFATNIAAALAVTAQSTAAEKHLPTEPALRRYAR